MKVNPRPSWHEQFVRWQPTLFGVAMMLWCIADRVDVMRHVALNATMRQTLVEAIGKFEELVGHWQARLDACPVSPAPPPSTSHWWPRPARGAK